MPSRSLTNLGLKAFFVPGEDNWGSDISNNFLKLSTLVQGGVTSIVTTLPASPTQGSVYLLSATATLNANSIAVFDNGAWSYYAPTKGWTIFNRSTEAYLTFLGTAWQSIPIATISALAQRDVGTVSATSLLDRSAGDGRYALTGHSHPASGVNSFNNRTGIVTLTLADITATGFAGAVSSFNNRSGAISLIKQDITDLQLKLTDLPDFPSTFFARSGYAIRVNQGETGLEFVPAGKKEIIEVSTSNPFNNFQVGKYIRVTSDTAITLTVPSFTNDPTLPLGSAFTVLQSGAGAVTIANDAGVQVDVLAGRTQKIAGRHGVVNLVQYEINKWNLYGDLIEGNDSNTADSNEIFADSIALTSDIGVDAPIYSDSTNTYADNTGLTADYA